MPELLLVSHLWSQLYVRAHATNTQTCTLMHEPNPYVHPTRSQLNNLCSCPAVFPQRRWEVARAMRQPVQRDENKPFARGWREGVKKSLQLLAAHTNVLRSNLSGVLFASYFNKGAQWVYQTALMKGLLAGLRAAHPLDPECVFTINPPLCLQQATSSTPLLPPASPPPLTHKRPHLQERAPTPPAPPPRLPQNLSSITPQVLHTCATVHRHAHTPHLPSCSS